MTDHPSSVKKCFYFCNFSTDVLHAKALYFTSILCSMELSQTSTPCNEFHGQIFTLRLVEEPYSYEIAHSNTPSFWYTCKSDQWAFHDWRTSSLRSWSLESKTCMSWEYISWAHLTLSRTSFWLMKLLRVHCKGGPFLEFDSTEFNF